MRKTLLKKKIDKDKIDKELCQITMMSIFATKFGSSGESRNSKELKETLTNARHYRACVRRQKTPFSNLFYSNRIWIVITLFLLI